MSSHRDMAAVQNDAHMRERGIITTEHHPGAGDFTYVLSPIKVAGQTNEVGTPAPALGADTTAILDELGIAAEQVEKLRKSEIIK